MKRLSVESNKDTGESSCDPIVRRCVLCHLQAICEGWLGAPKTLMLTRVACGAVTCVLATAVAEGVESRDSPLGVE
jgi:hypothetical protein